jgi:hypothetical protein
MGESAISRWTPIAQAAGYRPAEDGEAVDFVYQNSVAVGSKHKAQHESCGVWNQLSGMSCMEDKSQLAQVQQRMAVPTLRSDVVDGAAFRGWCNAEGVAAGEAVWIVKDASANGGADMWVMGSQNIDEICDQVVAERTWVATHRTRRSPHPPLARPALLLPPARLPAFAVSLSVCVTGTSCSATWRRPRSITAGSTTCAPSRSSLPTSSASSTTPCSSSRPRSSTH